MPEKISNGDVQPNIPPAPRPIVVAGGGCVGLFLALLLTQSNIPNRVIVIEPSPPDPSNTRAIAHQPLIFPLFERAGIMPVLSRAGSFYHSLCFRTSVKNGSKVIAKKQFEDGQGQLVLQQGKFQELLMEEVRKAGGQVRIGWRVKGFEERKGDVAVRIEDEAGAVENLDAVYLIGADGGNSTVRKFMGLSFDGETLPMQLVAADITYDFLAHDFSEANFIIDSQDYGLVGRIDDEGLWRVGYGVPLGTSEEEILTGAEEKIRRMLPDGGRSGFEVKNIAPYKAQQRCAERFWKGRVGLCGDSAHLTNPYAGLGLASGIADASSLADVLVHILCDQFASPDTLLSSWSQARRQTFLAVVDKASRMAYGRVQRRLDTDEDINALLSADPLVAAVKRGMPMMTPSLETKAEELEGWA